MLDALERLNLERRIAAFLFVAAVVALVAIGILRGTRPAEVGASRPVDEIRESAP